MAEFPNTAILSRNERKEKDTHPEFKGTADVTCPCCGKTSSFWLDAWVNERRDDPSRKFFKIKLKSKDAPAYVPTDAPLPGTHQNNMSLGAPAKTAPAVQGAPSTFTDDSIPFAPEWR
jgi:hypothetical protein